MPQSARSRAPWAVRAVTAALGVLGWLTAQHLTFGLVEHTHLVADGHLAAHEHHYAGPVALTAVVLLGTGLVALLLAGLRTPGPRPQGEPQRPSRVLALRGWRRHSAFAVGAFAGVELTEQILAGDPAQVAEMTIVIGVGATAQVGLATVARQLSLHLLDVADALAAELPWPPAPPPGTTTIAFPRRRDRRSAQATPSPSRGRAPPWSAFDREPTPVLVVARQTAPLPR